MNEKNKSQALDIRTPFLAGPAKENGKIPKKSHKL
jgi:hypothetical protein